jgi:hypothetical protein
MPFFRTLMLAGLIGLSACGGGSVKDTLGIAKKAPDEFRVVARPPLTVPPQFNLRPPAAQGEIDGVAAHKQAESLITGNPAEDNPGALAPSSADTAVMPVTSSPLSSNAESQFLKNAGAEKADANVRQALIEDRAAIEPQEEESWWKTMTTSGKRDATVNAKEESERLKKNKEEGKAPTEGDTPEVKGRDTGVLGRILGY